MATHSTLPHDITAIVMIRVLLQGKYLSPCILSQYTETIILDTRYSGLTCIVASGNLDVVMDNGKIKRSSVVHHRKRILLCVSNASDR